MNAIELPQAELELRTSSEAGEQTVARCFFCFSAEGCLEECCCTRRLRYTLISSAHSVGLWDRRAEEKCDSLKENWNRFSFSYFRRNLIRNSNAEKREITDTEFNVIAQLSRVRFIEQIYVIVPSRRGMTDSDKCIGVEGFQVVSTFYRLLIHANLAVINCVSVVVDFWHKY